MTIEQLKVIKTADELINAVKADGEDMTAEAAEKMLSNLADMRSELDDAALENVSGGYTAAPIPETVDCPQCHCKTARMLSPTVIACRKCGHVAWTK